MADAWDSAATGDALGAMDSQTQRRKALAAALMQQSPMQQQPGMYAAPVSPLQGASQMFSGYLSGLLSNPRGQ